MTHRMHRDCAHDCHECHLADPELCPDFALMVADEPDLVRFCRRCEVKAWHADIVYRDGDGTITSESHAFQCPQCGRAWADSAS